MSFRERVAARVLIADNDESALSALLRGTPNDFRRVASLIDIETSFAEGEPDALLVAVTADGMDGYELCRRVRAEPELASMRVFIIGTAEDGASRCAALDAGADDFFALPEDAEHALTRIASIARVRRYRSLVQQTRDIRPFDDSFDTLPSLRRLRVSDAIELFNGALATLRLALQPIVHADGKTLVGREALVRSDETMFATATELLSVANRVGRYLELSRAVRRCAARMLAATDDPTPLFINLTPIDFLDSVLLGASEPLLPFADRVVFEVTESAIAFSGDLRQKIAALRGRGFRFAVDGIGGNGSKFDDLAVIEPEYLKLGRELISAIDHAPARQGMVRNVIACCHDLGVLPVAVGVETDGESRTLASLGCELQQGFLFGRPANVPRLDAFARDGALPLHAAGA